MATNESPPLPSSRAKNLRFALTLNVFLPGAGQIYLGQTVMGSVCAVTFLGCFIATLTIFLRAYANYLRISTSGSLLDGDNLEQLGGAFPVGWLIGLLIGAVVIHLTSLLGLAIGQRGRR